MEEKTVVSIINQALMILENEVGLAKSSLRVVASCSFKPVIDFFNSKQESNYNETLIIDLEELYQSDFQAKIISRNVHNVRMRGTRILREVNSTGTFVWKGPAGTKVAALSESNERIVSGVANANISKRKNQAIQYVVRSFLLFLADLGINDVPQVEPVHIHMFLSDISKSQTKSMDHVISSLRKMNRYLIDSGMPGLPYAGLLMAPRARESKIYPCMPFEDMNLITGTIDRGTAMGKRDYAILLLAAACGIRTGDIANIKLSDIDWRANEIHITQGNTHAPLSLPLQKNVGAALADYILNGRPKSKSPRLFIRNLAPYQGFADGTSVACNVNDLKEDIILNWCSQWKSESPSGARKRIGHIRELLKYLSATGIDCYVIPSSFLPRAQIRTPYIFTDRELLDIFNECDNLASERSSPHRHLILPVLLRLIFFCGLRPNEGRELQSGDIDFEKGIMLIRKNKSRRERYIALSEDVLQMCRDYRTAVECVYDDRTYFFPSPDGVPYNRHWLARNFRMIWKKVRTNETTAVIYDFRHHFAFSNINNWVREGKDANTMVAYLCRYMGHASIECTYYYLHFVPEFFKDYSDTVRPLSDILPEVEYED